MKTRIISAFPACGKSYLGNGEGTQYSTIDIDSSDYSHLYISGVRVKNPEFPKNYIEYIKSQIGMVDFIFVSTHIDVRDALYKAGLSYSEVFPSKTLKDEWLGRCWCRGDSDGFLVMINHNWEDWVCHRNLSAGAIARVTLISGEYLSDKLDWLSTVEPVN